jgi:hypothetical protein
MTKVVLVVFTNVTNPEHDDAYNTWYDDTHLADVVTVPGFTAAPPATGCRTPKRRHRTAAPPLVDLRGGRR